MTIREIGEQLRSGKTSAVELAQVAIDHLRSNDRTNSAITITEEQALETAIARDKELAGGMDRGPFHGVTVAYKDLFYTKGVRTTAGSLLYREFVPSYDATVVERFANGGAVCVAKANLHELAYGTTSKNPHYGFVRNPYDLERMPGGSSGGSAALVASGVLPLALGTDTGGSIRIPASYCGVVGLKPTYGRVSRYGVLPLAFSLDHVGPIGLTVEDCALAMNEMAGTPDLRDPTCIQLPEQSFLLPPLENLQGVRVGVPTNFFFDQVEEEIRTSVMQSIERMRQLGAEVVPIDVPNLTEINIAARVVQLAEAAAVYANAQEPSLFGADLWALLEQGRLIKGHEYVNAQRLRSMYRRQFDRVWQSVDLLATPTTPTAAPLIEQMRVEINGQEEDVRMASTRLVRAINYLGEPALSMPCGMTAGKLPIGLQLISPPFTEPELLQVARVLERTLLPLPKPLS